MFGFFKQDWRLVKTITIGIRRSQSNEDGKFYYHLYESNKGNKKVEFASTLTYDSYFNMKENGLRFPAYNETIVPWLAGRVNPEIPTYSQVPIDDTATILRGKK